MDRANHTIHALQGVPIQDRSPQAPLVSVITPVHNGESHLSACIESVLAQTYDNWEYVIVNNRSTDATGEIARSYAARDRRIRVHDNTEFLPIIANWNNALAQRSPDSRYCKVLHADDWLFEECLARMVEQAEAAPGVGIVGSYVLKGTEVAGGGLAFPSTVVSGRKICRETLRKRLYVFGSPSSLLLRNDVLLERTPFYNEGNFHADVEACLDVLQRWDFGFVHQVLSYTRMHQASQTETVAQRLNTNVLENVGMFLRYGRRYLDEEEYQELLQQRIDKYYRTLAAHLLRTGKLAFIGHHRGALQGMGLSFSMTRLAIALAGRLCDRICNPRRTLRSLYGTWSARRPAASSTRSHV